MQENNAVENMDHILIYPNVDTIAEALPDLDINCEYQWPPLSHSAARSLCPYNLRSMGGKQSDSGTLGGLGQTSSQSCSKNKRGRKSDMSKAKLKAKPDVADGKQYSIPGVLRAAHPPERVKK